METEFTLQPERPIFSQPYPMSHPRRLATLAKLFGLEPTPIAQCKVLELGCGQGNNLIPMAQEFPESRFVGVDGSAGAVAAGNAVIAALGLKNIVLKQHALVDLPAGPNKYAYVIAHGLFSRLFAPLQEQLLAVCAQVMEPAGLAYISYNVYPGWHGRGMVAEMLRYHLERITDPVERIAQARSFLGFLAKSALPKDSTYHRILREEEELLRQAPDWVLHQDYLEPVNNPVYFCEFNERARSQGLRYVSDAQAASMAPKGFDPDVQQVLERWAGNRVQLEQYQDFLGNRLFRHTILCHAAQQPNYRLDAPVVLDFSIASSAKPVASVPNLAPNVNESFRDRSGTVLTTSAPIVKAALLTAGEIWPLVLPFRALLDAAILRLGAKPDLANREQGGTSLAHFLLGCFTSSNMVELYLNPPTFVTELSARPAATPLARWQAKHGSLVTTQRHEPVVLSEAERHTACLLDGTRDRAALVRALLDLVERGILAPQKAGQQVTLEEEKRLVVEDTLTQILTQLGRSALLVA